MPLAFFCTLFFRHRKKSVSAPWDGQSQSAPESARQAPGRSMRLRAHQRAFRSPFGNLRFATRSNRAPLGTASPNPRRSRRVRPCRGRGYAPAGAPKGFPRGKQSARPALPCVPLVVCLNSGSLTAFGGCIHWILASLRSPLETFGSPPETIERPIGLQALLPRRSRRASPAGAAPPHASRHENRAGISPCSVFMQTPLFLFLFLRPFRSLVQTVLVLPERTFRLLMNQLRVQTVITALSKARSQHEPQLHP